LDFLSDIHFDQTIFSYYLSKTNRFYLQCHPVDNRLLIFITADVDNPNYAHNT